ncbi:diguanylate cyclase domain-containing protein [Pseudomonas citronellolis]|uniref:diguanylate cyclase domain-containing protein n=1 Tax=Pseudomonas citronellolis TaxID=53408 RepID=UPI0023E44A36|nr:diguanylate cyclase [Pseudomonas citronellolis]MDF3936950.1 diguanylate cyclase [Pseudomonas citronellolis]
MRLGLVAKLGILLAGIGILSSGVTGYYAYTANQRLLADEAQRNLLTSTQLLAQRFSALLDDISADTLTLANMPSSPRVADLRAPPDEVARERLTGVFATFMRLHPQYSQVRLIAADEHGLEVIRLDRDGRQVLRVGSDQLQEKGHLPYVFESLQLPPGKVFISPITVSHEHGAHAAEGAPTLRVATPVSAADGTLVGVAVINVDLKKFLDLLLADLPSGLELYLTNEWGDFLVHPDPSMTFGFDKGRRILIQDSIGETHGLFEGAGQVLVNDLQGAHPEQGRLMAFVRKPFGLASQGHFVVLGLARPLGEVLASGHPLGLSIVQMVLVFSLLAAALAVLFARALTRPLQMLIHAARRFQAEHTLEVRLPLERQDEIGVLARGFDQLRKELKARMEAMSLSQQELHHQAHHDSLTGLPNRVQFFQSLERALVEVGASHEQLALLFIDLDYFKRINDEMGHAVGDEVLTIVARRLRHAVRENDLVARLGGDEFVVLLRGAGIASTASTVTRKILAALSEKVVLREAQLQIGASVGISLYPEDGRCAEELLLRADGAMYRAKIEGRRSFACQQGGGLEIERRPEGG